MWCGDKVLAAVELKWIFIQITWTSVQFRWKIRKNIFADVKWKGLKINRTMTLILKISICLSSWQCDYPTLKCHLINRIYASDWIIYGSYNIIAILWQKTVKENLKCYPIFPTLYLRGKLPSLPFCSMRQMLVWMDVFVCACAYYVYKQYSVFICRHHTHKMWK